MLAQGRPANSRARIECPFAQFPGKKQRPDESSFEQALPAFAAAGGEEQRKASWIPATGRRARKTPRAIVLSTPVPIDIRQAARGWGGATPNAQSEQKLRWRQANPKPIHAAWEFPQVSWPGRSGWRS